MDYGARFYDAKIGRGNVVDPMAENHYNITPFAYVLNDPLKYIDPLGLDTITATDKLPNSFNPQNDVLAIEEVVMKVKVTKKEKTSPPAFSTALTIGMTTREIGAMLDGPLPYADVSLGLAAFSIVYLAIKSDELGMPQPTTSTTAYGTLSLSEIINGMVNSKGGPRNIWPDQYGYPPNVKDVDWKKSDGQLADELSKSNGDDRRGGDP